MKRRDFLGNAIIGTAGVTLGVSALLPASCRGANEKVVVALIGCGGRGLADILACCGAATGVEVKTVCDVDDQRSARAASEIEKQLGYRPAVTRFMDEVFDDRDVDAVYIATPDHWHALATIKACRAKKDVYVEKTPSASVWEGRQMAEAARKYKRIVQAGFQNRSAAYAAEAREYIQSGKLGQVVHIRIYNLMGGIAWVPQADSEVPPGLDWDQWLGPAPYRPYNPGVHKSWHNFWAFSPGTLNDASHQLDLARMVMGDPGHPVSVYGWGGNHILKSASETPELLTVTYDYEKFTMTCDSGNTTAYMTKTPNDIRMDPARFPEWKTNATRIEIYGADGVMFLGRHGGGWQVFGPKDEIVAQAGGVHSEKEHHLNFIESVKSRQQPNAGMEQAHLSASLVHFANIAYRTGSRQLMVDTVNETITDSGEAAAMLKPVYRDGFEVPGKV